MDRLPPGWPAAVRPPGDHRFEATATAWLLDLCPPDYRAHPVLRRHPRVLAWLAARHVRAEHEAMTRAAATVRADLGSALPGGTVEEVVDLLDAERVRSLAATRGVERVAAALRGEEYVPRL